MFTKYRKLTLLTTLAFVMVLGITQGTALANFTNGPENPGGGIVTRGEEVLFLTTWDYDLGWSALHNGDIVAYCTGNEEPIAFFDFQHVDVPSHADRIVEILHAEDVPTEVWPFIVDWEQPLDDICEEFLNSAPLAVGTAKFRGTDNDLFAWMYTDNKNVNAFGWTSQGKLYGPDGEKMHFSSVYRVVWDGVDGERLFNFTSKINLK